MTFSKKLTLLALCLSLQFAQAQQFKPVQENPFGINTAPYSYNDMQFADLTKDGAFDIIFNAFDLEAGPFIMVNGGTLGDPDFNGVPYLDYTDGDENGIGYGSFTGPGDMYYDIDNDGDLDLLFAYPSDDPTLESGYAFELNDQEETNGMFLFFFLGSGGEGTEIGLPLLPPMIYENPTMGDLDNDGDHDILAVRYDENTALTGFYFYENISNGPVLLFNNSAVAGPFGLPANLDVEMGFGFPCLIDGDLDGDLDLIVSELSGDWTFYENTGDATAPSFGAPTTNPLGLTKLPELGQVHAIDVNNDGLTDLIVGSEDRVFYFEHSLASPSIETPTPVALSLGPNPASNLLTLQAEVGGISSVSILDANGKVVKKVAGGQGRRLDVLVGDLPNGTYFANVEIVGKMGHQSLRFVKS